MIKFLLLGYLKAFMIGIPIFGTIEIITEILLRIREKKIMDKRGNGAANNK